MDDLTRREEDAARIVEQAALLDEAREAIVVLDLDLRPSYWNKAAAQLCNFATMDIAEAAIENLYCDLDLVEAARQATMAQGCWSGELQVRRSDGRVIVVSSHWSLFRDQAGLPRSLHIICTDTTEKKSLEAQIARAQRMEGIATLVGGITHDLNNVLAPIASSIAFLKSAFSKNEVALETLELVEACTRRGADLVKQVVDALRAMEGEESRAPAADTLPRRTGLPRGDGEIILVVDDQDAVRRVVRSTLERFGYAVMLAENGAEAVALYAQNRQRIALVLTDMSMPVMDGLATIVAIKAIDAEAKIVGSSGLAAISEGARATAAGARYFVTKPYSAETLLTTLAKALGKIPDDQ